MMMITFCDEHLGSAGNGSDPGWVRPTEGRRDINDDTGTEGPTKSLCALGATVAALQRLSARWSPGDGLSDGMFSFLLSVFSYTHAAIKTPKELSLPPLPSTNQCLSTPWPRALVQQS